MLVIAFNATQLLAQCPMCKASVESNMARGETVVGMGLNDGILYLMAMPYIAVALIAFIWYRSKKRQDQLINGIS